MARTGNTLGRSSKVTETGRASESRHTHCFIQEKKEEEEEEEEKHTWPTAPIFLPHSPFLFSSLSLFCLSLSFRIACFGLSHAQSALVQLSFISVCLLFLFPLFPGPRDTSSREERKKEKWRCSQLESQKLSSPWYACNLFFFFFFFSVVFFFFLLYSSFRSLESRFFCHLFSPRFPLSYLRICNCLFLVASSSRNTLILLFSGSGEHRARASQSLKPPFPPFSSARRYSFSPSLLLAVFKSSLLMFNFSLI